MHVYLLLEGEMSEVLDSYAELCHAFSDGSPHDPSHWYIRPVEGVPTGLLRQDLHGLNWVGFPQSTVALDSRYRMQMLGSEQLPAQSQALWISSTTDPRHWQATCQKEAKRLANQYQSVVYITAFGMYLQLSKLQLDPAHCFNAEHRPTGGTNMRAFKVGPSDGFNQAHHFKTAKLLEWAETLDIPAADLAGLAGPS